jgi:hypothetical protein
MKYVLSASLTNDKHLQVYVNKNAPQWVHTYFCNRSLSKKAFGETPDALYYILD